jgi:hypothetical protein
MVNQFDEVELSRLGILIKNTTPDYFMLEDKDSKSEIIVWKIGNWLQFRCRIYDLQDGPGSSKYAALSETINRMHDVALGARVSLSDTGEVVLVSDILHSTVNNDLVATMSKQLLFLSEKLLKYIDDIARGGPSVATQEIDDMFS